MDFSKSSIVIALCVVFCSITSAYANDNPEDVQKRIGIGNPVEGKAKAAPCMICHGQDGNSAEPVIPKLSGQFAAYLQRQIYNFQEGTRSDPDMTIISSTLTDRRDLEDISSYFASQNQMTGTQNKNEEGGKLYLDKGCPNCHGENGRGNPSYNALFPVVGGQHKEYLVKQMKDFKTGARDTDISGIMGLLTNQMTDSEIEAVAGFLSGR